VRPWVRHPTPPDGLGRSRLCSPQTEPISGFDPDASLAALEFEQQGSGRDADESTAPLADPFVPRPRAESRVQRHRCIGSLIDLHPQLVLCREPPPLRTRLDLGIRDLLGRGPRPALDRGGPSAPRRLARRRCAPRPPASPTVASRTSSGPERIAQASGFGVVAAGRRKVRQLRTRLEHVEIAVVLEELRQAMLLVPRRNELHEGTHCSGG